MLWSSPAYWNQFSSPNWTEDSIISDILSYKTEQPKTEKSKRIRTKEETREEHQQLRLGKQRRRQAIKAGQ